MNSMVTTKSMAVTGVSSFVGHHLAIFFARRGYRVIGSTTRKVSAYDNTRARRLLAAQGAGVELAQLDITNREAVRSFIKQYHPMLWIHHAGWAIKYAALDYDLKRGHAVNVAPLEILYPALVEVGCQGIVLTGSSAEYSDSDHACSEEDPCWPATPYGLAKLAETIRANQLAEEFGLRTRVARVFIPYGEQDAPSKLIPSVVDALRSGRPVDLSPCEQRRDFIYVSDLVHGYEALIGDLQRDQLFDIFNLCSGEAVCVKEVLHQIADILDSDPGLLMFGKRPMRPGESLISVGSTEKAVVVLRWRPRTLRQGLESYLHGPADDRAGRSQP